MENPRYTISPEAIANGINDLLDELEEEKRINNEDLKLIDELQDKIDKAIDYIMTNHCLHLLDKSIINSKELLDILKGSDKE